MDFHALSQIKETTCLSLAESNCFREDFNFDEVSSKKYLISVLEILLIVFLTKNKKVQNQF